MQPIALPTITIMIVHPSSSSVLSSILPSVGVEPKLNRFSLYFLIFSDFKTIATKKSSCGYISN